MIDERKLIEYLRDKRYQLVFSVGEEKILDNIIKVIEKQPKVENTENFKHFKLFSDSTLKIMTKDDLIDYIYALYKNWSGTDISYSNVMDYAETLQNDIEQLEKALDKACELLEEQTEEGDLLCPCEYLGICHCMSTENGYECNGDNDYKWKEALMKDVD